MSTWSILITLHAVFAGYALLFGGMQILRKKRDRLHRIFGWVWVSAMAVSITTSFGILTISGSFGVLHALSVFTACTVTIGVLQAKRRNFRSHKAFMVGSYIGLIGAFAGAIAVPSRRIPTAVVSEPILFLAVVAAMLLSVIVVYLWARPDRALVSLRE